MIAAARAHVATTYRKIAMHTQSQPMALLQHAR
jgi:hypothetical protein